MKLLPTQYSKKIEAGTDEAGRGCLAGPVVSAAVILKEGIDLSLLKESFDNSSSNGTNDTYSTFKAFEEGSETLSKESNTLLASRQEKFIRDLKYALIRIENNTFGVCRKTGKLISKKRLELVPHATLSIEAKKNQNKR